MRRLAGLDVENTVKLHVTAGLTATRIPPWFCASGKMSTQLSTRYRTGNVCNTGELGHRSLCAVGPANRYSRASYRKLNIRPREKLKTKYLVLRVFFFISGSSDKTYFGKASPFKLNLQPWNSFSLRVRQYLTFTRFMYRVYCSLKKKKKKVLRCGFNTLGLELKSSSNERVEPMIMHWSGNN